MQWGRLQFTGRGPTSADERRSRGFALQLRQPCVPALRRATIQDAVDPDGILLPGKQGIWPKRFREDESLEARL